MSREWHDGLPCPTRGAARWGIRSRVLIYKSFIFFWFVLFSHLIKFCFPDDFADKHATEPEFSLVNKESLDKILRAKVFVHENGQLQAAHLILGYKPISTRFQAPKCVIKAKDPRLYHISAAIPRFLLPEGTHIPEGALVTQPIPEGIPKVALPSQHPASEATSSQATNKEEDKEEEEKEKKIMDISDSDDLSEVFN